MNNREVPKNVTPIDRLKEALKESQKGGYRDPASGEKLPNNPYPGVAFVDFEHPGRTTDSLDVTARIAADYDRSRPPSPAPKTPAVELGKIIQFPKRPSITDNPEPPQAS